MRSSAVRNQNAKAKKQAQLTQQAVGAAMFEVVRAAFIWDADNAQTDQLKAAVQKCRDTDLKNFGTV